MLRLRTALPRSALGGSLAAACSGGPWPFQPQPAVERVLPNVLTVLGQNPSAYTLNGTNTYLVGTGSSRILIDTGEGVAAYHDQLEKTLEAEGVRQLDIVITHHHRDHVGGLHRLASFGQRPPAVFKLPPLDACSEGHPLLQGVDYTQLHAGQLLEVEGAALQVLETPGHAIDHASMALLGRQPALFVADCVLGEGTTVVEDLAAYMQSLQLLLEWTQQQDGPTMLLPGHGCMIADGQQKLQEYIAHRNSRLSQVLQAVRSSDSGAVSAKDIVATVYGMSESDAVYPAAVQQVSVILRKLVGDGEVTASDGALYSAA